MLHAKPSASFFEYSSSAGLDGDACRLILNRLNDDICARFLGNASIGYEFSETTAAHVVRTYDNVAKHLTSVLPHNAQTAKMLEDLKAKIMIHDISDILRENIVASTELDPDLKAKCAQNIERYDLAVTPFVYKLALIAAGQKRPAVFDDMIFELREKTIAKDQIGRGMTMDEVLDFTAHSTRLVQEQEAALAKKYPNWNSREVTEKTATMRAHYYAIEQATTFTGMQAQIHEKCDGTDYGLAVAAHKQQNQITPHIGHVPSHMTNRFNGRFEKNLAALFKMAGNNPTLQIAAATTAHYCYGVSKNAFLLGKTFVSLDPIPNEPTEHDKPEIHKLFAEQQMALCYDIENPSPLIHNLEVVELYNDARDELYHNGTLWLPAQNNTLLGSSTDIQRIELEQPAKNAMRNLVR